MKKVMLALMILCLMASCQVVKKYKYYGRRHKCRVEQNRQQTHNFKHQKQNQLWYRSIH